MKMKTESEKKYANVKDPQGTDHYCPVETDSPVSESEISEACVEKDVVERYSGNIEIRDS
jgi:hypothetical protein